MMRLRPYRKPDGTVVWMLPNSRIGGLRGLGSVLTDTRAAAGAVKIAVAAVPGAVSSGLISAGAAWLPLVGPIGIAAGAVIALVTLIEALDKSEERKNLAAQRGQYEAANSELISQNFQLDSKIKQVSLAIDSVRGKIKQTGLAGPGSSLGCDFGIFNCAYDDEKKALENSKNAYNQLQYENELKRNAGAQLMDDFNKLSEYFRLGTDFLQKQSTGKKVTYALIGTAVMVGIGVMVFSGTSNKEK